MDEINARIDKLHKKILNFLSGKFNQYMNVDWNYFNTQPLETLLNWYTLMQENVKMDADLKIELILNQKTLTMLNNSNLPLTQLNIFDFQQITDFNERFEANNQIVRVMFCIWVVAFVKTIQMNRLQSDRQINVNNIVNALKALDMENVRRGYKDLLSQVVNDKYHFKLPLPEFNFFSTQTKFFKDRTKKFLNDEFQIQTY